MGEVNGFAILIESSCSAVTLVIAEAVFYTDDDPVVISVLERVECRQKVGGRWAVWFIDVP